MGGLMQLVAYGAQDIYLQDNPGINWSYANLNLSKTQFFMIN
jgi:hypothetical protein